MLSQLLHLNLQTRQEANNFVTATLYFLLHYIVICNINYICVSNTRKCGDRYRITESQRQ